MRYNIFPNLDKLKVPKRKLPYLAFFLAAQIVYLGISSRLEPSESRVFVSSCIFVLAAVIPCRGILAPFLNTRVSVSRIWMQGSIAWIIQQTAYYQIFKELKELLAHSEGFAMYMDYFREYLLLIPAMVEEEICVLFALLLAYNLLPFRKTVRGIAAAAVAAAYFGASHIFCWGSEYGLMVFTTRLFVELFFLRVMDLRPFIFFHTVNDWAANTLRFEAMYLRGILILLLTWPMMHWFSMKILDALGLRKRWMIE